MTLFVSLIECKNEISCYHVYCAGSIFHRLEIASPVTIDLGPP